MISTVYSGEAGGVIARNFLEGGTFERFPSLFASADRFSGVAMMQLFLTFVLFARGTRAATTWGVISLFAGVLSLLVAGARSRIIIVCISLSAAGIVFLMTTAKRKLSPRMRRITGRVLMLMLLGSAVALSIEPVRERAFDLPILAMLEQTLEKGDIGKRVGGSFQHSSMPEDVTWFGEGLGTTGAGRPGEFGIRAMWIESGLLWTPIMLALNIGIVFLLIRAGWRYAHAGNTLFSLLSVGSVLAWLLGLLGGLSGTFELSQALLLFPTIAVISMMEPSARASSRGAAMQCRQPTRGGLREQPQRRRLG